MQLEQLAAWLALDAIPVTPAICSSSQVSGTI